MSEVKFWVALNRVPRLGPARFRKLESYFGSLEHAWNAGPGDLKRAGMDDRVVRDFHTVRTRTSPDMEMERLERASVTPLPWHAPGYPGRLKEIPDPPPVLYSKGEMLPCDEKAVAVVGTRSPTSYGREAAEALTKELSQNGITVVSGLARGIDGIAHRTALESGGRTIAVLASGLDIIYPKEHGSLAHQTQENGALLSEHPLGVKPDPRAFPRRNRLISGISLGTLVVEAGMGSGSRWTVYHALEQGREVFCVPGTIFSPNSRLTNQLIQEGAKLVASVDDILEELNLTSVAKQMEMPLPSAAPTAEHAVDDTEGALLGLLSDEPVHIDDIGRSAGIPIAQVSGMLTMLELKGMARQVGCMHYVRVREVAAVYGN